MKHLLRHHHREKKEILRTLAVADWTITIERSAEEADLEVIVSRDGEKEVHPLHRHHG